MSTKQTYIFAHALARQRAKAAIDAAPDGYSATIQEPARTLEQNAKFHAICRDIARSGMNWCGKPRSAKAWKVLLISGHAVATKEGAEVVPGLEGEYVNIRESSALMSISRGASLI